MEHTQKVPRYSRIRIRSTRLGSLISAVKEGYHVSLRVRRGATRVVITSFQPDGVEVTEWERSWMVRQIYLVPNYLLKEEFHQDV